MPKIYEYFGFVFFFYALEHEPIHVHVMKGGCGTVFNIILENGELKRLEQRSAKMTPMSQKDTKVAEEFVRHYYKNIVNKWINFFIYKKAIRSTKITKKL